MLPKLRTLTIAAVGPEVPQSTDELNGYRLLCCMRNFISVCSLVKCAKKNVVLRALLLVASGCCRFIACCIMTTWQNTMAFKRSRKAQRTKPSRLQQQKPKPKAKAKQKQSRRQPPRCQSMPICACVSILDCPRSTLQVCVCFVCFDDCMNAEWEQTVRLLLNSNVPVLFTSFTAEEAKNDAAKVVEWGAKVNVRYRCAQYATDRAWSSGERVSRLMSHAWADWSWTILLSKYRCLHCQRQKHDVLIDTISFDASKCVLLRL